MSGSGHYYDYMPDQVQRYVQRDEFESVHSLPTRYNWSRSQPGFHRSLPVEEPGNQYNWNRTQPGFHHSQLDEPANQYNRNRIQTRLPHWEEPPSFPSQDPGYPRRLPNPRRPIGAPLRFNSIQSGNRPPTPPRPPIRVVVLEDSASSNAWQTQLARMDQSPPSRSPPPPFRMFMQQPEDDSPQSSTNESKLTTDEQHKVLAKLRKEIYNPATPLPNLYFRDRNHTAQTQEASKDKDENWKRCAVCLEDFEAREMVTLTPCNHMFHEDCIVPWVKNHGLCPVCRFAICERLKENATPPPAPPRRTGVPPPRRLLPPPPPPSRDNDMFAIMRALVLEEDYELQSMIPALLGR